jgi:hypothetical protein
MNDEQSNQPEQRTWHLPTKRKGESKVRVSLRIDPLFTKALSEFSAEQSKIQGIKISSATVIVTSVLRLNKTVDTRYKQLKRENNQYVSKKIWDVTSPASIR